MIIEDQESFKAWLSAVLEPLCDADPAALAKYVFALVKKDKPAADLRAIMIEQLDVFLQQETKKFVDLLFKKLETQVFELPAVLPVHSDAQPSSEPTVVPQNKCADGFIPHQTQSVLSEPLNVNHQVGTLPGLSVQTNGTISSANSVHKKELEPRPSHRKSDSDKEDKPRTGRVRHRSSASPTSRPRSRSRSRSWDRSRRSRSRERDRARERDRSRAWRNKSPPSRSRHDRGGSDRRRSWSRSNSPTAGPRSRTAAGSRSRSRSPRYNHRGRYRNRSPPARSSLSRSRSRSNDRIREKKEPLSGAATPTQDSNHGDVDMRLTTTSQSIQSVVSACSKSGTENGTQSASTPATFLPKRRCRDFDEKGYCMRGDLCPYDHGNDPVVLEDVALSRVLAFGPAATSHNITTPAQTPASEHVPPPTMPLEQPVVTHSIPPPIVRPAPMEYNPDAPSMEPRMVWGRTPFTRGSQQGVRGGIMRGSVGRPVPYNPQPQRELISVPVTDQGPDYKRPRLQQSEPNQNVEAKDVTSKKKTNFDFNRLGPRHKNPNNCSLELKKVPRGLNNITHLNNHFAKFGKIVNIQVSYEGDPEAAIITFSSHAEANAAYRSTEAVLNNRFIKVFWHNSVANEGKQENVPPSRPSVKERLGVPNPPVQATKLLNTLQTKVEPVEKVIMSGNNLTKTVYIPTALKKPEPSPTTASTSVPENKITAAAAIKKGQEILAAKEILKKKQEEKRKEAVKITVELRKRKQDLLEKQLAQQKVLIERLERSGPELRVTLMATIKTLQESIEAIRKDLKNGTSSGNTKTAPTASTSSTLNKKSKEEAQREILDAELDLFTKQQEGGDTTELQKRVAELKMEAHNLGLLRPKTVRPPLAPRTTFRGRGRGFAHVSVDHRPTKVLVSGYEEDEKADVISHFSQYGEIVDYITDDSTPSLILNYKSRKEAEVAMLKGRNFQDRLLSVTWCTNQTNRPLRSSSSNSNLISNVHLHHGLPHRSVVLVGGISSEGQEEQLPEDEDEVGTIELSEDVLLQDDEEEDEDGEDRSWRR